ncbi:hypothetical protein KVP09_08570 [Alcaligenaceae bacterium CGII-47]|nr:hypothetical protein [Alcaligenaceae bacterium CGII-47]
MIVHIASTIWQFRRPLFLGCLLVFCYGVFRPEPPPDLFQDSDKALHILAFAGLSFSARLGLDRAPAWLLWPALVVLAPLTEWLQHIVQPTREFSLGDIQANLAGIVLGSLTWMIFRRLLSTRQA